MSQQPPIVDHRSPEAWRATLLSRRPVDYMPLMFGALLVAYAAWAGANGLQWAIVIVAIAFALLFPFSRKRAYTFGRISALLAVCAVMLLPFVWLACAAFKDRAVLNEFTFLPPASTWSEDLVRRDVDGVSELVPVRSLPAGETPKKADVIPGTVNLDNFRTLFEAKPTTQGPVTFWRYLVNSLFLASAGTVISLFFCSLGGYALAKYNFRGKPALLAFMLASLTVPGVLFLAPNFEIIWRLGWMDSYKALLVPGAVGVFGIFLFRQAMLDIPTDLIEAGRIDGCGEFRIYFQLVMPLVRPMIGAFCLISFLGAWNSFLGPNIYLQTQSKLTLPVVLNQYIGEYAQQYGVFLAGTLIAIIPPAVLFFALQREFISGLQSGALKQ
jgi:ABC-type glycerol-3-phosphate transport system permease component